MSSFLLLANLIGYCLGSCLLNYFHFPQVWFIFLLLHFIAFVINCLVWLGEESVITFICHQRAGKNMGKKPLVTLVTNWAFLIKTDAKQRKTPKQSRIKEKWKAFYPCCVLVNFSYFRNTKLFFFSVETWNGWWGVKWKRISEKLRISKEFPKVQFELFDLGWTSSTPADLK